MRPTYVTGTEWRARATVTIEVLPTTTGRDADAENGWMGGA
jgi:hypothetical protein